LLRSNGIDDVVLCVGYRGEQIAQVVGLGTAFGLRVRYAFDGEQLLGTGGAVRRALGMLGDEFFVLYGDSYLPCDYQAVLSSFRASGKLSLMTVYRNEGQYDTSNVHYDAGMIRRYDKSARSPAMRHIDYGWACFGARRSQTCRMALVWTWPRSTKPCWPKDNWQAMRYPNDFSKSVRSPGWRSSAC